MRPNERLLSFYSKGHSRPFQSGKGRECRHVSAPSSWSLLALLLDDRTGTASASSVQVSPALVRDRSKLKLWPLFVSDPKILSEPSGVEALSADHLPFVHSLHFVFFHGRNYSLFQDQSSEISYYGN